MYFDRASVAGCRRYLLVVVIIILGSFELPQTSHAGVVAAQTGDAPLERIFLDQSGSAVFEHELREKTACEIEVNVSDARELLKSLQVLDAKGRSVVANVETYGGDSALVDEGLKSLPIDLSDGNQTYGRILGQLRGAKVKILISEPGVSGRVVGVLPGIVSEKVRTPDVVLLDDSGKLTSIPLDEKVQSVTLLEPEKLQGDLKNYLDALQRRDSRDRRTLRITVSETAVFPVTVRYRHPLPPWEASYRLTIGRTSTVAAPLLSSIQAFARVENTSAYDWDGVQLTLAFNGQPYSFGEGASKCQEVSLEKQRSLALPLQTRWLLCDRTFVVQPGVSDQAVKSRLWWAHTLRLSRGLPAGRLTIYQGGNVPRLIQSLELPAVPATVKEYPLRLTEVDGATVEIKKPSAKAELPSSKATLSGGRVALNVTQAWKVELKLPSGVPQRAFRLYVEVPNRGKPEDWFIAADSSAGAVASAAESPISSDTKFECFKDVPLGGGAVALRLLERQVAIQQTRIDTLQAAELVSLSRLAKANTKLADAVSMLVPFRKELESRLKAREVDLKRVDDTLATLREQLVQLADDLPDASGPLLRTQREISYYEQWRARLVDDQAAIRSAYQRFVMQIQQAP